MYHLLPLKWSRPDSSRHHHPKVSRQRSQAQPDQAAFEGGVPAESGGDSRRLGCSPEPAARSGGYSVRGPGKGGVASFPSFSSGGGGRNASFGSRQRATRLIRLAALAAIRGYQIFLSPLLPPACRYYPTCSAYAFEAVEKWGVRRGLWFAARRLIRCHPWGGHGYDPVPERQ